MDLGEQGKTNLYRTLLTNFRSRGMIAIATSAIMSGDRTTYSRFVLPLNPKDTALCVFSKQDGVCRIVYWSNIEAQTYFLEEQDLHTQMSTKLSL